MFSVGPQPVERVSVCFVYLLCVYYRIWCVLFCSSVWLSVITSETLWSSRSILSSDSAFLGPPTHGTLSTRCPLLTTVSLLKWWYLPPSPPPRYVISRSTYLSIQIANPYETNSDSFYFVDDKLIMHNKVTLAPPTHTHTWNDCKESHICHPHRPATATL